MVGGFSSSSYLTSRIFDRFHERIPFIAKPRDCDVSTLQGAARYGLGLIQGRPAVSSVIAPRSYLMKVRFSLPFLPSLPSFSLSPFGGLTLFVCSASFQQPMKTATSVPVRSLSPCPPCHLTLPFLFFLPHAGFITTNAAGVGVCENRLSYLVAKGAVLRKGQRLKTRFTKFSRNSSDSIFTALLFVCDDDKIYRYTDEGEISASSFLSPFLSIVVTRSGTDFSFSPFSRTLSMERRPTRASCVRTARRTSRRRVFLE
jgi:hypothetical protein